MPKVYIPNRSFHDFSGAREFGEPVFLTDGVVQRLNVNQLYRECTEKMKDSTPEDYLLISSLGILNAIAASIMVHKFGRVRFLMFSKSRYVVREIVMQQKE